MSQEHLRSAGRDLEGICYSMVSPDIPGFGHIRSPEIGKTASSIVGIHTDEVPTEV